MVIDFLIPSFVERAHQTAVTTVVADPDAFARGLVLLCDLTFGLGFTAAVLLWLVWLLGWEFYSVVVKHGD